MATFAFLAITLIIPLTDFVVWGQENCTPWIYNVETKKCYRKFCDESTADRAEQVCKDNGGHLVTVCSDEENVFVGWMANFANDYSDKRGKTWIGMYRDPNNKNNWLWKSGATCGYKNWHPIEPNNALGNEDNVHYWSHRNQILWNDHPGYVKMHYMCERKMCPLDEQIE